MTITIDDLVRREVILCASHMIGELSQHEEYQDELCGAWSKPDYESPCYEYIFNVMDEDECREFLDYHNENHDHIEKLDNLRKLVWILLEPDSYQEFIDEKGLDEQYSEVLEHWIVSPWLANRLEEQGEIVLRDFMGFDIWGRSCSGQAISQDGVTQAIYKNLIES